MYIVHAIYSTATPQVPWMLQAIIEATLQLDGSYSVCYLMYSLAIHALTATSISNCNTSLLTLRVDAIIQAMIQLHAIIPPGELKVCNLG